MRKLYEHQNLPNSSHQSCFQKYAHRSAPSLLSMTQLKTFLTSKRYFFTCERVEEAGWTNHHQIDSVCMHVKELKSKRDAVIECPWSLSTIAKHAGKTQKEGSC